MKNANILFLGLLFVSIGLGRFYTNDPISAGDEYQLIVNVVNPEYSSYEDVSVKLVIYDLGIILVSRGFDVSKRDNGLSRIFWDVPESVPKGTYLARLTVSNDKFKDVEHLYVTLK